MRVKGALHIHSRLSHDGTMTIAELARWYKNKGYQFLAMGEHAEDLDDAGTRALCEQSAENSGDTFCVIPGIEFAATKNIHIVGIGITELIREAGPVAVIGKIRERGGFSILAHPKRVGWDCPADVVRILDAAEIWNVGYDGKYLPSPKAPSGFSRMQKINPNLLAVASHDFHKKASFYDVAIEMDVASLDREAILQNLGAGRYQIRSRFFRAGAKGGVSKIKAGLLKLISAQLSHIRQARTAFRRLTAQ